MGIGRTLYRLRTQAGLTQEELANQLGVTSVAVSYWEIERSTPRSQMLSKIAEYFNTTVSALYESSSPLKGRSAFMPLVATAHMGQFEDEENIERMVEVPATIAENHPHGFVVHGFGTCMNKQLPEDAVLVIDPDMTPRNGAVVLAESEQYQALIRTYFRGSDTLILSADSFSDEYEDIVIRPQDEPIRIVGVVVWYQSSVDVVYE